MLSHLQTYKAHYGVAVGTVLLAVGGYLTGTSDLFSAAKAIVGVFLG